MCLAPVGRYAWPSEGPLSPEVALRPTVGPPRHGTAPAAGRATSGVVVNGRPRRLVLTQVRAALAHLRLLGGALNLGPVVEVRYEWRDRDPSATERWRAELGDVIEAIFADSDGTYGHRRVHAALLEAGRPCDPQTVRTLMRERGLVSCQPRPRGPRTTVPAVTGGLPDLLQRDFTACEPGVKLVGDITYIPTWEGWVYLATVLDCFSKKVVGYALADHMRTELVTDALGMAIRNSSIRPGAVFHSDRGTQYMSGEFAVFCGENGIVRSVGRTGICYDNAWAESFNGTLKVERVNRTVYPTRDHAVQDVTRYIELRYNQKRLHSGLEYSTPNRVEAAWYEAQQAA